jgi:hypothetical protein
MSDDRYTVDDPPEEKTLVYFPSLFCDRPKVVERVYHRIFDEDLLPLGISHRTPESAEAHARRMLMADEILGALEAVVLAVGRPVTAQNLAVLGAKRVIARARGEVAG